MCAALIMPRTLIISDLHMGHDGAKAVTARSLAKVFDGIDELIINGDVAELDYPRFRKKALAEVESLKAMTDQMGIRLRFLTGNHDPLVSDDHMATFFNGEVVAMHGHAVHPGITPWWPSSPRLRRGFDRELEAMDELTRSSPLGPLEAARTTCAQEWARVQPTLKARGTRPSRLNFLLRRPHAPLQILWYWATYPRRCADFAHRYLPDCRVLIVGHSHRHGIWRRGHLTIINTGAYRFPGKPRGVVITHDALSLHRIALDSGQWRVAEDPLWVFQKDA